MPTPDGMIISRSLLHTLTNEILIVIKDEDMVAAQHIGEVRIPAEEVLKTQVVAWAGIMYWILLGSSVMKVLSCTLMSYSIQLTEICSSSMELLQRGSISMRYPPHSFAATISRCSRFWCWGSRCDTGEQGKFSILAILGGNVYS